jgi:threonine/homoserine/homoserine lactone efflux protein
MTNPFDHPTKSWKREIGAVLFLWWIAVGSMIFLAEDAVLVAAKAALYRDITPWALGAVFSVFGLDAVLKSRAGGVAP